MIKAFVIIVGDGDFKKAPMPFGERNTRALRQSHKTVFFVLELYHIIHCKLFMDIMSITYFLVSRNYLMIKAFVIIVGDGEFKKAPMPFGEGNTRALRQSHKTVFFYIIFKDIVPNELFFVIR